MASPATATGYSGLFSTIHGQSSLGTIGIRSSAEAFIGRELRSKGDRATKALIKALNGVAAGGSASYTQKRIKAKQGIVDAAALGGTVEIETQTLINRVTTAADQTNINNFLDDRPRPSTYATDRSGNGGGGKLGF